jgi:predicted ATPase
MICKYVITGGPSSGKTTTINELKKRDFIVVEESARDIIEADKKQGKNIERTSENMDNRQTRILNLQLKRESIVEEKAEEFGYESIFLDRSVVDGIAYYHLVGLPPSKRLLEDSRKEKTNYCVIFFLEMLPYVKDDIREDEKTAEKIAQLLYETYEKLGYKIIKVPVMPLQERVKFILKHITNLN